MGPPAQDNTLNKGQTLIEEDDVAVIGFSMRFPGDATSPQKFWQMIEEGRSVMTEVPADRFNINGFYHPESSRNDTVNCRGGHFLTQDIAAFDAPFFSMNPSEVESMDPQQRGLLETSYRAFENAGLPLERVTGSNTSVYVGALGVNYSRMFEFDEEVQAPYKANGNSGAILANRLSWFYDLLGPSMTIETACSGSMVGLHLACQSLHSQESKMSLVCGTSLYLEPLSDAISLSALQFISPDSLCHSFDARGNGYSKGEGIGVLILKRLNDAVADGDVIRAVIRGTAINQDGHTPSMSQPSLIAQERLIRTAYQNAGLDFKQTRLFEAHGPGTLMGDPIEAGALRNVFQENRSPDDPLYVGSVKANVGHLEAAAGIAGVIKAVLCLEKGIIPPIAGLQNLNPQILSKEWNLEFPKEVISWPTDGLRRASVNAFGYGGSNAHAILDDAYNYLKERGIKGHHVTAKLPPARKTFTPEVVHEQNGHINNGDTANDNIKSNGSFQVAHQPNVFLFVYSAVDAGGIDRLATVYKDYLAAISHEESSTEFLHNLAYTLSNKRSTHPWKSFVLAESAQDLTTKLQSIPKGSRSSASPKLLFIFTGQGAQWARMGVELSIFPKFLSSLQEADTYMKHLGSPWSLIEELQKPKDASKIDSPELAQPLCTVLQIALVELLASWGIAPSGVAGHSSGEIAGAFSAGSISREFAWSISYFRGALASRIATTTSNSPKKGAMMVVGLSASELQPYFEDMNKLYGTGSLSVGCFNSSRNTTVSGLEKAIDRLKTGLEADGAFARKLKIPVAYHSSHMQVIADEYLGILQKIAQTTKLERNDAAPLFASSVTGKLIDVQELSQPEYWVRNLISPVQFSQAISELASFNEADSSSPRNACYFVEIGPHPAMQRPILDSVENAKYGSTMRRDVSGLQSIKQLCAELWVEGFPVHIDLVNRHNDTEPNMITDLPEYPFNHSNSYWLESRLWKNYRTRGNIRHELRGIPVTDWNPYEPKFRFTIRLSDLPWIKDHQLNGTALYPGAGLAVMAFEAARYLNKPGRAVVGYRLQNVSLFNALPVPDTPEGVESQIYLRNQENSRTTGSQAIECRDFRVCSYTDNEWREICAGSVTTEYEEVPDEIYACDETKVFRNECQSRYREALNRCTASATAASFYESNKKAGYGFGPTFNTLHDIAYDPNGLQATAIIFPDEWKSKVPEINANVQPYLIHPSALDGIFQVIAVVTTRGNTIAPTLQAPTQFRDFWISHSLLFRGPNAKLQVLAETTRETVRETEASLLALNSDTEEPVLLIEGYQATTVSHLGYTPSERRNIFYRLDWKADVDMLTRSQKNSYIIENEPMVIEWEPAKEVVVLYYMAQMLKELDIPDFQPPTGHLQKYITWVRNRFEELGSNNPLLQPPWKEIMQDKNRRDQFLDEFSASGPVNKAIFTFIKELVFFIRGEADPLDLLFNQNLADGIYADIVFTLSAKRMAAFIDLLAHKNSSMDILELGAGTGSGTMPILSVLGNQNRHEKATPRFSSYAYTDISPSFFGKAKVKFADYADRMTFRTLDIEKNPLDQGFEPGKYNLIIAATMMHATKCVADTLSHARTLLKPGGYLVIMEPTNKKEIVLNGIWGTLSGWWRSTEADRSWSPLYTAAEWDHYLRKTGYTGCESAVTDYLNAETHTFSMISSRAASQDTAVPIRFPQSLLIVAGTEAQQKVAQEIEHQAKLKYEGCSVQVTTPEMLQHQDLQGNLCVSLLEIGSPFLSAMSEKDFGSLKRLVETSSNILWVTDGAGEKATVPENAMSSGFSRALTMEHQGVHMANLDIDNIEDPEYVARIIRDIIEGSFSTSEINDREGDYQVVDGTVLIPRAVEAHDINDHSHAQNANLPVEKRPLRKEPMKPLQVQFSPGQLDSFRFVRDADVGEPLADDEVEVEVKASPINFKDVMVVLGQVTDTYIGYEYAGVVRRVGAGVKDFAPNNRVTGLASGTFKTFLRHQAHTLIPIPDDLPFVEALPAVWLTALYGIVHLGRLQKGESVLIHAAAGAVGQAAIQLAQHIGADVFVSVSSTAKKELLQRLYNIPNNRFFSSRRLAFGRQIMRATSGRGVDVILNSLSGEALVETWKIIAPLGRFVEIGKRDMETFQKLPMYTFVKNATFASVDLQAVYTKHPALISQLMSEMKDLVFSKTLRAPHPVTLFSPADFEGAFRYLQTGRHMGKAVIDWEKEAVIPVIPSVDPEYHFDSQATYVITGGLGGIGRSLASWISTRGVKHLILLSRSGAISESARRLIDELARRGVNVATPRCDISNEESLEAALKECDHMPPIKGVIQGAMVLKDRPFDLMTKDEWQAVLEPKLTGTWNLHNKLPHDMDFFVILSSLGGMIGARGQSQYNAAATFQDAFARHRWSQGQKCISIDIGLVTAVGYVAEQMSTSGSQQLLGYGLEVLREKELHSVVDWACNPSLEVASGWNTQVLSALNRPKALLEQGKDLLPYMKRPMYRHLRQTDQGGEDHPQESGKDVDYVALLKEAGSVEEGGRVVASALAKRLSQALSVPEEDIDTRRPAHSFGVDSLVAVELRFWFANAFKAELSLFNIIANISIQELAMLAASKSEYLLQKE